MTKKKKSDKKFDLKKEYISSWNFIKESKHFLWVVLGLFVLLFLIGVIFPAPAEVELKIMEFLKELMERTAGMNNLELTQYIMFNNIKSSFMSMIFGVLLGVVPIISILSNGYLLGFVSRLSINAAGIGSLWRLLPHGIFELPAMFISFTLGIRLGFVIFKVKDFEEYKNYFVKSLKVFLLIIIPLLIVAAIIEGALISLGI